MLCCTARTVCFAPKTQGRATRALTVRASSEPINPSIKKEEAKVVDAVAVPSGIEGKQAVYCRCWRSGTFPLCNGAHVKHNAATGDNVGPLIIKKDE